jgi:hypothetical protein
MHFSMERAAIFLSLGVAGCGDATESAHVGEGSLALAPEKVYYPPDVVGQFTSITDRADALGFGIGDSPNPEARKHYQSIQRSSGPGTPYLFVSRSGNDTLCIDCEDDPGNLLVVKMASRATDGERLRSNRLARNTESADSHPDSGDVVVKTITFDGQGDSPYDWPNYGHPGGMQLVGDVLAVPLEHPYDGPSTKNHILFLDVSNPENPQKIRLQEIDISDSYTAGLVSIAALPDGKYLMLVTGKNNDEVRFFESDVRDTGLHDPELVWTLVQTWFPDDDPVDPECEILPPGVHPSFPNGFYVGWPSASFIGGAYQTANFIRQGGPDGRLFLLGGRNTQQVLGSDWFDLLEVTKNQDGDYRLSCAAARHVHTFPSSDGALLFHNNLANFAAGSGSYVSPTGELILYGTEHDNDGPGGTVKMGEWRHIDMVRHDSPTYDPTVEPGGPYSVPEGSSIALQGTGAPPRTKAWVQLWADDDWTDRYVVIDYPDWSLDDFDNFKDLDDANNNPFATGFSDQATSARWFAPVGCTLRLNDDDFGDDDFPGSHTRTLPGDGTVHEVAHLDNLKNNGNTAGLDDELTSQQFFSNCDTYYDPASIALSWDLDGNGSFETAAGGSFSAATLDGPSVVSVDAQATHTMDGRVGSGAATIDVVNVAPILGPTTLVDGAGRVIGVDVDFAIAGLPVALNATFTDPGTPDTQTAQIGWGDGATSSHADLDAFTPATGGVVGSVKDAHAFAAPGTFSVSLEVADDDGGIGAAALSLQVIDAAGAIQSVIDALDALIATTTGPGRKALQKARDDLAGSNGGGANNGALDELDGHQLVAAIVKIASAIDELDAAEAATGLDLTNLKATLVLAAEAIGNKAYLEAVAANSSPTPMAAVKLATIEQLLQGAAAAAAGAQWTEAMGALKTAVQLAASMY